MFAAIYRFRLKPHQEASYINCWNTIVDYFAEKRGAIGSCLHKSEDGLWVAYSRWPDKVRINTHRERLIILIVNSK